MWILNFENNFTSFISESAINNNFEPNLSNDSDNDIDVNVMEETVDDYDVKSIEDTSILEKSLPSLSD